MSDTIEKEVFGYSSVKRRFTKVIEKMTTERDLRNQMEYALQEAIAEGHAAGHAEGLAEGLAEAARKMVASGMTHEAVADILQIPEGRLKEML